jgi:hypothetical protein
MPADRSHLSPTAPALMYLPTPGHFLLRPQLLTHTSVFPRAWTL